MAKSYKLYTTFRRKFKKRQYKPNLFKTRIFSISKQPQYFISQPQKIIKKIYGHHKRYFFKRMLSGLKLTKVNTQRQLDCYERQRKRQANKLYPLCVFTKRARKIKLLYKRKQYRRGLWNCMMHWSWIFWHLRRGKLPLQKYIDDKNNPPMIKIIRWFADFMPRRVWRSWPKLTKKRYTRHSVRLQKTHFRIYHKNRDRWKLNIVMKYNERVHPSQKTIFKLKKKKRGPLIINTNHFRAYSQLINFKSHGTTVTVVMPLADFKSAYYTIFNKNIIRNFKLFYSAVPDNYKLQAAMRPISLKLASKLYGQLVKKKQSYLKTIIQKRYKWYLNLHFTKIKWYRKRIKRWITRFRKIKKNKAFNAIIKTNFLLLTGISERNFYEYWSVVRRGNNNYWGGCANLVQKFSHTLLLTPANLLLFLRFAPSIMAAMQIIKSGGLIVNGLMRVNRFFFIKPGDILQIIPKAIKNEKYYFSYHHWNTKHLNLAYLPFLQIDWSMLLIMLIRWPLSYELIAPSFLAEKWVRYYIRWLPSKARKALYLK